jgi:hypothetical protein
MSSLSGSRITHSSPLCLTRITATVVIELLIKRAWYRIRGTRSADGSNNIPPTPLSPAIRLPQEVVEMIIAHLISDNRSLLACSLTCYSWYIASIPHLHHTLVTWFCRQHYYGPKPRWSKPLRSVYKLGLLPLVKKLQIRDKVHVNNCAFSQKQFNCRTLRHF